MNFYSTFTCLLIFSLKLIMVVINIFKPVIDLGSFYNDAHENNKTNHYFLCFYYHIKRSVFRGVNPPEPDTRNNCNSPNIVSPGSN